ncbi:hypothetical protein LZ016_07655 [Sphingomonas sp. SM33]|jgi:hypothetical protein|uniref:Uncharacterized protein n=1 Tax=Sphingomonas telluris TaxID=2907998 RepID=A0ABS9VLY7_9SPHN|nr:hypothetical protein [Sphingomonas telluris]MCH8615973.1 hypothetical protein [Sphingomonas telluris]
MDDVAKRRELNDKILEGLAQLEAHLEQLRRHGVQSELIEEIETVVREISAESRLSS